MKASVFVVLVYGFVSITKAAQVSEDDIVEAVFLCKKTQALSISKLEECTEAVPATMTDQCKCFWGCVGRNTKFVQADGSVNQQYLIDIVTEKIGEISEDQETVMRFMFSSCEEKSRHRGSDSTLNIKEKPGCVRDFKALHCAWGDAGWPGSDASE